MRFSVAFLLWLMGCIALVVGLTSALGFTGFVVSVSLVLVALLGKTAPRSMSFQKSLVALCGWGGGLFGWCLMDAIGASRWIGHTWWRAEADTVAAFGSGSLAVAIAAYLVLYKGAGRMTDSPEIRMDDEYRRKRADILNED